MSYFRFSSGGRKNQKGDFMRKKKRLWVLICTLALVCSLIGCGTKKQEEDTNTPARGTTEYPVTVTGSDKAELTFEKEPEKIVSVGPNITEIIYSLEVQEKLVGRTDYCDYPAEVSEIESIGPLYPLDVEKIISLSPDLIIGSAHFDEESKKKLEKLNIPVLYLYEERSVEGVYAMIQTLGTVLNASEKASAVVEEMKQKLDQVKEKIDGLDLVDVYYVVGFGEGGEFTAGGDTFIHDILTLAGGKNIAEDVSGWSYSLEKLIEKDPTVILLPSYFYDSFITTEPYNNLTAVKNNRVYVVDENKLNRQCARNADIVLEIASLLHPDIFKSKDQ